ncbi:ROK family transcriptional regulator [Agrobacterium pusense]|uniref:ROK family transcriptional regulator n=1 Tax=Agrobacterium pusense TaxID=648995 RepID=U4PZQ1_9HYPH|nr:ROK family transcriptional regulator [Agrobacterium pusense]MBM7327349.1 ROK family transcriptional regulator [Agrobacterium sp. S2]CDI06979.1 ROK family transcriptional regulator [Agrobacterium pusense]
MRQSVETAQQAPPTTMDMSGGANQIGVRAYNERLVLSLVRRHGGLSKAEIARLCGLSAQTVSVIMRSLEKDGLLIRGERLRGRVGQPSTPMRLNPDAVFSFGVKIGRRSVDLVLMDFVGHIRLKLRRTYPYPLPEWILPFVIEGMAELESKLSPAERQKIAGVGIAAPFELWNWAQEVGAPQIEMERWRDVDIRAGIAENVSYPVFLQNDATSACGAELVFGAGQNYTDFLYVFIGSFIGGGVVLNSALFSGKTGTAGAIGPLPVQGEDGNTVQLLKIASIFVLENMLRERGIDPRPLWFSPDEWIDFGEPLESWIGKTAAALAQAVIAAASIIDFSSVIIDGGFPDWVRTRIVAATREALKRHDLQGVTLPEIVAGAVGSQARAIGGASLPLFSRYLIDQNVLFKDTTG